MYSAERRQDILRLIQATNHVSVDELAERFAVSPSSIRRDLNELHRVGLLQRTYGGAIIPAAASAEAPFSVRVVSRHEEKDRIGKAAARLVQPGDTIFIDGGTTTECMLPYLLQHLAERSNGLQRADRGDNKEARLTVVTYGLNIVQRLTDQEGITVIMIGGILHSPTLTFSGVFANESFEAYNIRFDKAFMAATGVSAEAGITNAGFEEVPIKRRAMRSTREAILLADSSKIGVIAAGVIAPTDHVQRLITTAEASPTEVDALRRRGVIVDLV